LQKPIFALQRKQMKGIESTDEVEKLKKHAILELAKYSPDAVITKTIIRKLTGDITLFSIAAGKSVAERFLPFDSYIQLVHGTASLVVNNIIHLITQGEGIIIPAHIKHHINAGSEFKMIVTVIKSGYEE
jgi:quercetin dioxygenase-like cupin family protein